MAVPQISPSPCAKCGIADEEPGALHEHRVAHGHAGSEAPVVHVAAEHAGRDAAAAAGLGGRHAHHADVRAHVDLDLPAERAAPRLVGRGDEPGHGVRRQPVEVEPEQRPCRRRELGRGVGEAVDRDPLLAERVVEQAPVGGAVRPVRQPRRHLQDLDDERVAGRGAGDGDRAGHDVHAGRPLDLGDGLPDRPHAVVHHQVGGVAGVVGDRFDRQLGAVVHGQHGLEGGIEEAPEAVLGRGGQAVHGLTVRPTCVGSVSALWPPRDLRRVGRSSPARRRRGDGCRPRPRRRDRHVRWPGRSRRGGGPSG